MKLYKGYAYCGLAWLYESPLFEDPDEANEWLQKQCDAYCGNSVIQDKDALEAFWFNSRIEELEVEIIQKKTVDLPENVG